MVVEVAVVDERHWRTEDIDDDVAGRDKIGNLRADGWITTKRAAETRT
jgi:hypothetical protein